MLYEIKINEDNVFWNDVFTRETFFNTFEEAERFCVKLSDLFKCDVRLNEKDSTKGFYYYKHK